MHKIKSKIVGIIGGTLLLALAGCQPAHQYAPLTLTNLNMGQSRTLDIAATGSWRDSAIRVRKGEVYRVATHGTWSASPFCGETDASGLQTEHLMCMKAIFANAFPMPEARIGALVGKIGMDGQPFVIGGTDGFIADRDGSLFLRMNEPDGFMFDNTGFIEVAVQRYSEGTPDLAEQAQRPPAPPQSQPIARAKPIKPKVLVPSRSRQQGTGFYGAEQHIGFNVLDNIALDPHTGALTLVGHFDPNLAGPRIPYLQHLAVLLDQPAPQVSLDWTPAFESRIAVFFERMDNAENMARLVGSGRLMDESGQVTPKGRLFLPIFGVKAFDYGDAAGALGVETRMKELGILEITSVTPGSAADRAGLRVGQEIHNFSRSDGISQQPFIPDTLLRSVRFAGAGTDVTLNIGGFDPDKAVHLTLDAYTGDSWAHMTRYDIVERIYRAGEKPRAANLVRAIGEFVRNQNTPAGQLAMWSIMYATNSDQVFETNKARYNRGEMPKDQMMADWMRALVSGMEDAMEVPRNSLVSAWEDAYRQSGDPVGVIDTVISEMNRLAEPKVAEALRTALYKNDQITMPVSVLDPTLDFNPEVTPRYINLDKTSELARLFVEADYVGKAIIHMPSLSDRIAAYKTEYEFGESRPGAVTDTSNRLWIEPARMQVQRNRENTSLQFGKTEMRINVARSIGGQAERYDDGYSRYLTRLYGDLAKEFYPLHELREAAKLAVAARWIKSIDPAFRLPSEGRVRLSLPQTLEGFVTLIWSPKRTKVSLIAPGGIDFDVPPIGPSGPVFPDAERVNIPIDASVVDLRGFDLVTTEPFMPATQTSIKPRHLRPLSAPPLPASVRLVGRATKGQRTLARLDGFKTQTRASENVCDADRSRAVAEQLAHARSIAERLQGVEDALNTITAQMPERQRTYAHLAKTFEEEQAHLRETALDLASSGMLGVYDELKGAGTFRSIEDFETLIASLRKAKSKLSDVSLKMANLDLAISAAAARSLAEREKATMDLLNFVQDTLGEAEDLTGDDALTRAFRTAGKTLGVAGKVQSALDGAQSLYQLHNAVETLKSMDTITALEAEGLNDRLLPLQRKLSDELDSAMASPVLDALNDPNARLGCGS